ncbi:MAG: glycosyltransferase family 39 protein [Myxococcota bacterium]
MSEGDLREGTIRRRRRRFALALFAIALAPRLWVALGSGWAPEPVWDGFYYDIGAQSIAAGRGYVGENGNPWCHYPVGYSAFLGAAYALFGSAPAVGKVAGAVVGAWLAVAVYALGRRFLSETRARIAGGLVAAYPGLVLYAGLHMTEPLSAALIIAAALAAARAGATGERDPTRSWRADGWRALPAGVLFGLATLVRPQSILLAPFSGVWFRARPVRRQVFAGVVSTAAALLVVSPWTVRNCLVMDGCAFVSTNGGWNLAIGAFPRATGRFETLRSGDGCHIVTGQVQQDRCWVERGRGWIREDPVRWVRLMPKKLGFTFDHESFPVGYLGTAAPGRWSPERSRWARGLLSWSHRLLLTMATLAALPRPSRRRPQSLLAPLLVALYAWYAAWTPPFPFWPLALMMVAAVAVRWPTLWRRRPTLVFSALIVASLVVVHAVFFGEDRYHLVATPWLCLMAASLPPGPRAAEGAPSSAAT